MNIGQSSSYMNKLNYFSRISLCLVGARFVTGKKTIMRYTERCKTLTFELLRHDENLAQTDSDQSTSVQLSLLFFSYLLQI